MDKNNDNRRVSLTGKGVLSRMVRYFSRRYETIAGLEITPSFLRLCQMERVAGKMQITAYAEESITGQARGSDEAISVQLKKMVKRSGLRTKYVSLSLPGSCVIARTLSIPQMSREELEQAAQFSGFWENFTQFPESASEYYTDYKIIAGEKGADTMRVVVLGTKKTDMHRYKTLIENAGLMMHVALPDALMLNAFCQIKEKQKDSPVAFLFCGAEENHLCVMSGSGAELYMLFVTDDDKDLLTGRQDVQDEDRNLFVRRFANQVQQLLSRYETQQGEGKVVRLYVMASGFESRWFTEALNDVMHGYAVSSLEEYVNIPPAAGVILPNGARRKEAAVAMGAACTRFPLFSGANICRVNLLPGVDTYRRALQKQCVAKAAVSISAVVFSVFLAGTYGLLQLQEEKLGGRLDELVQVEGNYQHQQSAMEDMTDLKNTLGKLDTLFGQLPSNQKQVLHAYHKVNKVIPEGVWLKEMRFDSPSTLQVTGHAINDQNILEFIRQLNGGTMFSKVALKTLQASKEASATLPVKAFTLSCTLSQGT